VTEIPAYLWCGIGGVLLVILGNFRSRSRGFGAPARSGLRIGTLAGNLRGLRPYCFRRRYSSEPPAVVERSWRGPSAARRDRFCLTLAERGTSCLSNWDTKKPAPENAGRVEGSVRITALRFVVMAGPLDAMTYIKLTVAKETAPDRDGVSSSRGRCLVAGR